MSNERLERQKRRDLGIVFVTAILPEHWPEHLLNTFQKIRSFRKVDFSSFLTGDSSLSSHQLLWRSETIERAREIVYIAATLIDDAPVEMGTRLRLENGILSRFYLAIDCRTCKKRLWRSDVEVVVERPGRIAKSLASRREGEARPPCQCPSQQRASNLKETHQMFSDRADEMMSFDFSGDRSKESMGRRRPDRILGFQETSSLRDRLDKYDLLASRLRDDADLETLWETVNSTVLNHEGNALLFPFLVIEAKSRNGNSFNACNTQTALPIWKMLKIQEDLQAKSQISLEYGGPLLWYIAYRGEDWRLSACYTSKKSGKPLYEIINLWNGQLNDGDSALQLLLIIDYIFDWARDVYRPSIISQLKILAEPTEENGHADVDGFTIADTDDDILSLARPKQRDIEAWGAAVEDHIEVTLDEELNLMKWAAYDSPLGVFRPACVVESLFRCICVTKTDIETLFLEISKKYSSKQLAKSAENVLNVNHVLLSEDVLGRMEEIWTNRARRRQDQNSPDARFFATVNYHVSVAENWELKRIIFCLAFDEASLNLLRQYHNRKSIPVAIKRARTLGKANAEALLSSLKSQSIQQNLASALASKTQELRPVAGAPPSSLCPTFEFVDQTRYWKDDKEFEWHADSTAKEVIDKVYKLFKRASEEPTQPYLRFSQHWSSLTDHSADSTIAAYFPGCEPVKDEKCVLAARHIYTDKYLNTKLHLCLYIVPGLMDPLSEELLGEALRKSAENGLVYYIKDKPNAWKDTCQNSRMMEKFDVAIPEAARLWRKKMEPQLAPILPLNIQPTENAPALKGDSPFLQTTRSESPSPSPGPTPPSSWCAPPPVKTEGILKRPFKATDVNENIETKKRIRIADDVLGGLDDNVIVIDDDD